MKHIRFRKFAWPVMFSGMMFLASGCVSPIVPDVGLETKSIDLGKGVQLEMVRLPSGLWFGRYEVTQAQWMALTGKNPSFQLYVGARNPVNGVSWNDLPAFLEKLNGLSTVKESGLSFRIPTDEEWVEAARAGAEGEDAYAKLPDGTEVGVEDLGRIAWFADNAGHKPHSVGKKEPNAFGLYDMFGNAEEIVSPPRNSLRDVSYTRGGWHGSRAADCRDRGYHSADFLGWALGFRLCAETVPQ